MQLENGGEAGGLAYKAKDILSHILGYSSALPLSLGFTGNHAHSWVVQSGRASRGNLVFLFPPPVNILCASF